MTHERPNLSQFALNIKFGLNNHRVVLTNRKQASLQVSRDTIAQRRGPIKDKDRTGLEALVTRLLFSTFKM